MPTFCVLLYNNGKLEIGTRQIVARNPKQAAEAVSGERLVLTDSAGRTRARVWEANIVPSKLTFFCRAGPSRPGRQ